MMRFMGDVASSESQTSRGMELTMDLVYRLRRSGRVFTPMVLRIKSPELVALRLPCAKRSDMCANCANQSADMALKTLNVTSLNGHPNVP